MTARRAALRAAALTPLVACLLGATAAEARWFAPVDLSPPGEYTGAPHVVLDAAGDATAVWNTWNGKDTVVESAYRPAGQGWEAPLDISEASGEVTKVSGEHDAGYPQVAVDAAGNVTVVWERALGGLKTAIQADYRPAGGAWQAPVDISTPGTTESAQEPWVGVDENGDATAVWKQHGTIEGAYRPAGGEWQPPVDISEAGKEALTPKAAVDAEGDATAVWMLQEGGQLIARTAYRPAGEGWGAPTALSAGGEEGGDPAVALDAAGDAVAIWGSSEGYDSTVRGSYRPKGGEWQPPVRISLAGESAQARQVALDGRGDALVAWAGSTSKTGSYDRVKASFRPAGGSWGEPVVLSQDGGNAFPDDVAFDEEGDAVLVWQREGGSDEIVQAAYRPAGGAWLEPTSLSEEGEQSVDAAVVLNAPGEATAAEGAATVVWTSGETTECGEPKRPKCEPESRYTVQASGYDPAPAQELQGPATGVVGAPVAFSAQPLDVFSPLLEFGDGTSIEGFDGTHTYTQPGRYTVSFASTEVLGYRSSTQRSITIAAAGVPTVEDLSPQAGPLSGGTLVTVTGTNFMGTTAVRFGSAEAASFKIVSPTSILAEAPAGSAGAVDVTVTNAEGTSAESSADRFEYAPAPTVSKLSPRKGPAGGGAPVTISGTGFTGATTVSFGSSPATELAVVSATTITAVAPAAMSRTVDVTVSGPGGTSDLTKSDRFTFEHPTVTDVSPDAGPTSGGASVVVNGTGFAPGFGGTAFIFGRARGSLVDCTSTTECSLVTPAGRAGTVDVRAVVGTDKSKKTDSGDYTYG